MNDLRERLLLEDGIDPNDVTEPELAQFRTLLAEEQKRARRLGWLIQVPLWGAALLLLGVCVAEDLWDRLHIPFLAASSLVVIAIWLVILALVRPLAQRLEETKSHVGRLKSRLPEYAGTRPRGIPLLAREGSTRFVFWPGALLVAVLVGAVAAVVGNVIWLILTGRLSGFVTAWQIVLGVLLVVAMIRRGLTRPPEELITVEHPNRLLWFPVPRLFTLELPRRIRVGAVSCLVAILGIAVILSFFQSGTVYARVLSTLRQAQSIHAVGYGFQDSQAVQQSEIWHERNVGTRIHGQRGERLIEMYDDGRDRYEYVEGNEYAVKKQGQSELLPRELVEPLRYLDDARRDPPRDRSIKGVQCQCYARQDPNTLSLMWIDEEMRFTRYEEYRRGENQWQQVELVEIGYDEPLELQMPPETFERRGIRIVEPDQVLETRYGLENAIARTEVLGLVFAVHELHKCGDYLLIACSVRPTTQSLNDLRNAGHGEPVPDHMSLGGFDLSSWWQRKADGSIEERPYALTGLGSSSHKGVDIRWYAMLPRGQWPGQDEQLEVCAHVRTGSRLQELRRQNGLDWHGEFRPLVTVNIPPAQSNLADLAKDLYELGHMVTAVSRSAQDLFVSEDSGITQEQFQQRFEDFLAGLRPMGELWDRVGSNLELRLVDEQGAPVAGTWLGSRVTCSNSSIRPEPGGDTAPQVSDDHGRLSIPGERLFGRDSSQDSRQMVYAIHPDRRLVACRAVGGDDFGSPLQIVMTPACRVRVVLTCPDVTLHEGATIQAGVSTAARRAHSPNRVILDVLRCATQERSIEILLPTGDYELRCYANHDGRDLNGYRRLTVPADARTLDLGTVELRAEP